MTRRSFVPLTFLGLVGLDLTAVFLAIGESGSWDRGSLPTALTLHGVVAILTAAASFRISGNRMREERFPLSLLAFVLTLLFPVGGVVLVAWLTFRAGEARKDPPIWPGIQLGNPALSRQRNQTPSPSPNLLPLRQRLDQGDTGLSPDVVRRLRQSGDRSAVASLRHLQDHVASPVQHDAASALSSLLQEREARLDHLRRIATDPSPSIDSDLRAFQWERLASALASHAQSGLVEGDATSVLFAEAARAYDTALALAPEDPDCLLGLACCRLALGEIDPVPGLLGRLHAIPGAQGFSDALEVRYLAHLGRWREAAQSARRSLAPGAAASRIPARSLAYWVGSS